MQLRHLFWRSQAFILGPNTFPEVQENKEIKTKNRFPAVTIPAEIIWCTGKGRGKIMKPSDNRNISQTNFSNKLEISGAPWDYVNYRNVRNQAASKIVVSYRLFCSFMTINHHLSYLSSLRVSILKLIERNSCITSTVHWRLLGTKCCLWKWRILSLEECTNDILSYVFQKKKITKTPTIPLPFIWAWNRKTALFTPYNQFVTRF